MVWPLGPMMLAACCSGTTMLSQKSPIGGRPPNHGDLRLGVGEVVPPVAAGLGDLAHVLGEHLSRLVVSRPSLGRLVVSWPSKVHAALVIEIQLVPIGRTQRTPMTTRTAEGSHRSLTWTSSHRSLSTARRSMIIWTFEPSSVLANSSSSDVGLLPEALAAVAVMPLLVVALQGHAQLDLVITRTAKRKARLVITRKVSLSIAPTTSSSNHARQLKVDVGQPRPAPVDAHPSLR